MTASPKSTRSIAPTRGTQKEEACWRQARGVSLLWRVSSVCRKITVSLHIDKDASRSAGVNGREIRKRLQSPKLHFFEAKSRFFEPEVHFFDFREGRFRLNQVGKGCFAT